MDVAVQITEPCVEAQEYAWLTFAHEVRSRSPEGELNAMLMISFESYAMLLSV